MRWNPITIGPLQLLDLREASDQFETDLSMVPIGTLSERPYPVQPRTQAELVTSRESWVLSETEAYRIQLIRNSDAKGELSSSGLTYIYIYGSYLRLRRLGDSLSETAMQRVN